MDSNKQPRKLIYRFAFLIGVFMIGTIIYGAYSFKTLNELKVNGPLFERIEHGKDLIADILPPPAYIIESYLVAMQLIDEKEVAKQNKLIEKLQFLKKDYEERHAYWKNQIKDDAIKQIFLVDSTTPAEDFYRITFDSLIPAVQKGDIETVDKLHLQLDSLYENHRQSIDKVVMLVNASNSNVQQEAADKIKQATIMQLAILLVFLLIATINAIHIVKGILKSLGGEPDVATNLTRAIAHGDLAVEIPLKNGDNESLIAGLAVMQKSLRSLIHQIQDAADKLFTASNELSEVSDSVAKRAEIQSEASLTMAASVEEVTVSINHVAESAESAHGTAGEAGVLLTQGQELFHNTVREMNQIAEAVDSTTTEIAELGKHSEKISMIINVIKEIADQTNLLALNAAIEAARAGDAGRGFAVVADEVRKLAEKTTTSTQEITTMINSIQHSTQSATQEMQIGSDKVHSGVEMADKAGKAMEQIEGSVRQVLDAVGEISMALKEQRVASNEIAGSVEKIARMTEENSVAVGSVSKSANGMVELAELLKKQTSNFKL